MARRIGITRRHLRVRYRMGIVVCRMALLRATGTYQVCTNCKVCLIIHKLTLPYPVDIRFRACSRTSTGRLPRSRVTPAAHGACTSSAVSSPTTTRPSPPTCGPCAAENDGPADPILSFKIDVGGQRCCPPNLIITDNWQIKISLYEQQPKGYYAIRHHHVV